MSMGGGSGARLVDDVTAVLSWTVRGDGIYYVFDPTGLEGGRGKARQLKATAGTGGPATILTEGLKTNDHIAADETGVYWFDDYLLGEPADAGQSFIKKYD